MIVERFKNRDPVPVYRRFREKGRMAPAGLNYLASWVDEDLAICFQIMETDEPGLFDEWIACWRDIVDFEIYPVMASQEAVERLLPRL